MVRVQKLSEQVVRRLGERIVSGDIDGDVRPPTEQEIAAEFEVSRTVAREVVATLESLNLVTVSHGRRMAVKPQQEWNHLSPLLLELYADPERVTDVLAGLHQMRLLLEPEIAAEAALHATSEDHAHLAGLVDRMRATEDDPDAYLEHDVDFHMALARTTDNLVLASVMTAIRGLLAASRRITQQIPRGLDVATTAHARIEAAVRAGDAAAAREAMRDHIDSASSVWGLD